MRTIAIVNQKGGCGKTTTAINLAAVYAGRGTRTLLIDLDPQAHCAAGLGVPEQRIEFSIGEAMRADLSAGVDSRLIWEVARNLHLAPSTMRLAMLEAPDGGLHNLQDKDRRLQAVLEHLAGKYDRCLIDCPPTIGLLTFNALRAAREVLIPVETGYFSLKGAEKQWETIQRVIRRIDRPIACHILPTLHDPEFELAQDILASLQRQFAGQILPVVIREHAELREAASLGQSIVEYAPDSPAREDFEALADWLDEHHVRPLVEIEVVSGVRPLAPSSPAHVVLDQAAPAAGCDGTPRRDDACVAASRPDGGRAAELVMRLRSLEEQIRGRSGLEAPERKIAEPETTEEENAAGRRHDVQASSDDNAMPLVTAPCLDTDRDAGPEAPDAQRVAAMASSAAPSGRTFAAEPRGPHRALALAGAWLRTSEAVATHLMVTPTERQASTALHAPRSSRRAESPDQDPSDIEQRKVEHLYGVRSTSRGVLFVQPRNSDETIYVAGDFNQWCPRSTPLRLNAQLDVLEALADLAPGKYFYRLVVGPRWIADPYNPRHEINEHGELNSIVVVPDRQATP